MNTAMTLTPIFEWLLNRSWQAGVLVLCVLFIQWLARRSLAIRWRFALWWIVLARLVLPFGPASDLSLFNCFKPLQNAPIVSRASPALPTVPVTTFEASDSILAQPVQSPPETIAMRQSSAVTVPIRSEATSLPQNRGKNQRPWYTLGISPTILAFAMGCWLAGATLLAALVLLQVFSLNRRITKTAAPADDRAYEILRACCRELRVRRNIELLETDVVKSPALFGLFRLRLLLPCDFTTGFDRSELRYVFLHELAHVRRGDLWINCLVTALQVLHWFNPIIWLGFARLRADRELACDEMALQHVGETAAEAYGMTIIKLLESIQHPSAMPGLVGILEDRTQMRRRISRIAAFKKATRWSALAVLLLPALGLVALTDAQSGRMARPNLTGVIETRDGQPIQGSVFIYTAGPKAGTSTFCPSCYADCQKSAKAGADGKFEIKSLDPQLVFRILAVAPDYKPKFVAKVDPAKGAVTIKLAPIELADAPPANSLHGRIVDTNGTPIAGAEVDAHGIRSFNGGGMWGQLDGVDPLAVTDEKGEFLITSRKPFDLMDVRVSARGYANKNFVKLSSGSEIHQLTLTAGAGIAGRVLFNGKPLANVELEIASADRTMESSSANLNIGTDSKGRFLFLNLPPNADYDLSGTMKSLARFGAIPVQVIHSGDDGSTTDAGDLIVTPGHRLSGRVILADGKPLPPKTRLLISRSEAWDSMQIELPPDGAFALSNVPAETYDLAVRVPGYQLSPKNASYDTMNPGRLLGRVDADTTNLTFLLEHVKAPTPQDYGDDESQWPQNRPLKGVGGNQQADHSQDWVVSGHVTDAQTREPIKQFNATPGDENLMRGQIHWAQRNAVGGTNGLYTLYLDKHWEQPVIKVEAEGYLPQSVIPPLLEQSNVDFALQKGNGPRGIVCLPNGKPVAGADVLLICPDAQDPSLRDDHLEQGWPRQGDILLKTGPAGRFSFEPRLGMQSLAAASPDGFARVPVSCLATNPNITLQPYGSIKGTLERPNGPGTNEDLDLEFDVPESEGHVWILNGAHTDSGGRFEFDRVPAGHLNLSYRVPVSQNGWQNVDLQQITVNPGETLELNIHAAARETRESFGVGFGSPPAAPVRVSGENINGSLFLPDGRPAANAQVGLKLKGQLIQLGKASLISYDGWKDGYVVRTDQNGNFSLPMYQEAESVLAVSDDGFAHISVASLKQSPHVVLQPWAKIEGTFRIGRHPGADQLISLNDWQTRTGTNNVQPLFYDSSVSQTRTDAQGRFILTYIPPGEHQLLWNVPTGNGSWSGEPLGAIEVKPGETKQVTFGGDGRTVLGKVTVGKNAPKDWQQGRLYLRTSSTLESKFMTAHTREQRMKIVQSAQYQKEMMNMRNYPAMLSSDGSFRAEDVVPGKYELGIDFFRPRQMSAPPETITYLECDRQLTVPKLIGTNDAPVDLGTIALKSFTMPTLMLNKTNTVSLK